jgi:hypothetical protein
MLHDACIDAIEAGVETCVVLDFATGILLAGADHSDLAGAESLRTMLLTRAPLANPFIRAFGHADVPGVGELLIVGAQRALFAGITQSEERIVILVAAPMTSVALGWSVLRRIVALAEPGP